MPKVTVALLFACALFAAACNRGPDAALRGQYRDGNFSAVLEVTADEIILKSNWMTLSANYKVLKTTGSDVTVELSFPKLSVREKGTMVIRIRGNSLVISRNDGGMFAGTWIRM